MDITIDIENVRSLGLSVEEFLFLRNLVVPSEQRIVNIEHVIRPINLDKLEQGMFIKKTPEGVIIRQKTKDLFQNPDSLADTFIGLFPIKTPKGRPLSPLRKGGKNYDDIVKKFKKHFTNQKDAQHAIKVLEAELEWRRKTDNLEYMNAIDAWLNQRNYEKFEYLLEDKDVLDNPTNYDWI